MNSYNDLMEKIDNIIYDLDKKFNKKLRRSLINSIIHKNYKTFNIIYDKNIDDKELVFYVINQFVKEDIDDFKNNIKL